MTSRRKRILGALKRALGDSDTPEVAETASVSFVDGPSGDIAAGTSVLKAAMQLGVELTHYCGGNRSCGTCRIEIVDGERYLSRRLPGEEMVLGARHCDAGNRLGCQARVYGPVVVRIPEWF